MKASWQPLLLFMALINLGGAVLAFTEARVFPGFMLLGNAGVFFTLLSKARKQARQQAQHVAVPVPGAGGAPVGARSRGPSSHDAPRLRP